MSLLSELRENKPPTWLTVVCIVVGAMGGGLVMVLDSIFLFKASTNPLIFIVSWPLISAFMYLWALSLVAQSRALKERRAKLSDPNARPEPVPTRTLVIFGVLVVLGVIMWIFRDVTLIGG